MNIIAIQDPLDPRIEPYCNIRERDLVRRDNQFIAEGKVVVQVLLRSQKFEAQSVLVTENRLAGIVPLLETYTKNINVYVVTSQIMDTLAGFHLHRGILAIGQKKQTSTTLHAYKPNALVVVLAGLANHDNVGSIFRNAAAFDACSIILDNQCCDPLYRKALRVSVGAVLKVPFSRGGSLDQIAHDLIAQDFSLIALSPRGEKSIIDIPKRGKRALILGTEGDGLPLSLLERLETWTIPMSGDFDSLNVATAAGISLFHASEYTARD